MRLSGITRLNRRYPGITLAVSNLLLFLLLFGIIEFVLRSFAPFHIATIGHRFSDNARKYGWGYGPRESLRVLDPDTGETYVSSANNHGWRDKDRQYSNTGGAYRILVLGDSVTYGAIVPAEKVYTRVLEDELQKNGYNIEVINISYGGWGTDQQLEALVNEGVKYHPNLIIVQFCTNDLTDNAYYDYAVNKEDKVWKEFRGWKPFYYELDENNVLQKRINPYFSPSEQKTRADGMKSIISRSEVLKRLYALYLHYSLREATDTTSGIKRDKEPDRRYRVTDNQLLQLRTVIGLREDSALYKYLHGRIGMRLAFDDLADAIDSSAYADSRRIIYRILENRWFHMYWTTNNYTPRYADPGSYDWRLYFTLIDEIKKAAGSIAADVAIFPETDEGHYEWSLSWYRVKEGERSKINYLSHMQVIRSAMKEKGIDVIDNASLYRRARNDPHPNVDGNRAMANDIFKYLMLRKETLNRYRNVGHEREKRPGSQ